MATARSGRWRSLATPAIVAAMAAWPVVSTRPWAPGPAIHAVERGVITGDRFSAKYAMTATIKTTTMPAAETDRRSARAGLRLLGTLESYPVQPRAAAATGIRLRRHDSSFWTGRRSIR